jgi:DNA repair exonuclease SbcCD ATPase subunit
VKQARASHEIVKAGLAKETKTDNAILENKKELQGYHDVLEGIEKNIEKDAISLLEKRVLIKTHQEEYQVLEVKTTSVEGRLDKIGKLSLEEILAQVAAKSKPTDPVKLSVPDSNTAYINKLETDLETASNFVKQLQTFGKNKKEEIARLEEKVTTLTTKEKELKAQYEKELTALQEKHIKLETKIANLTTELEKLQPKPKRTNEVEVEVEVEAKIEAEKIVPDDEDQKLETQEEGKLPISTSSETEKIPTAEESINLRGRNP